MEGLIIGFFFALNMAESILFFKLLRSLIRNNIIENQRDVINRSAMFIKGEPFFSTSIVIRYEINFAEKGSFCQILESILDNIEKLNSIFGHETKGIIYIINQLRNTDEHELLELSKIQKILIRGSYGKGIVISNSHYSNDYILMFDLGTVLRFAYCSFVHI